MRCTTLTNHILAAIVVGGTPGLTHPTHPSEAAPYKGLPKTYSWGATGELNGTPVILVHKVVNGQIT